MSEEKTFEICYGYQYKIYFNREYKGTVNINSTGGFTVPGEWIKGYGTLEIEQVPKKLRNGW